MDEDIVILIIETYKAGIISERKAVFNEVRKTYPDLEYGNYGKIIDSLHDKDILFHKGLPDHYVFMDPHGYYTTYKEKLLERKKKAAKDEKTKTRKDWKERNWILAKAIEVSVSTVIGLIIGGIVGYVIGSSRQASTMSHKPTNDSSQYSTFRIPKKDSIQTGGTTNK